MQLRASHILVETEQQAQQLIEQIKSGADFGEVARITVVVPAAATVETLECFPRVQWFRNLNVQW